MVNNKKGSSNIFFDRNISSLKEYSEGESSELINFLLENTSIELNRKELEKYSFSKLNKLYHQHIRSYIKNKYFSTKIENIVLFLGAGASIGPDGKEYGSTMSDLQKKCAKQLSCKKIKLDDIKKIVNFSKDDKSFENLISRMNSYLRLNNPSRRYYGKLKKAKSIIYRTIINEVTNYKYNEEDLHHLSIIRDLSSLLPKNKKLNVVTTNYDFMVEEAASLGNFVIFDGFTFDRHPKFNADMFDWNLVKSVNNLNTQEKIYNENVINLLKIHGSVDWKNINGVIHRIPYKGIKDNAKDEFPVMVFPSSDKYMQSYEEPYFELFSKFQSLLKENNTLLITVGFSFADNHIARMIMEALKNNKSLKCLITDHDIDKTLSESTNENWNSLIKMKKSLNSISFLKADMNDSIYGLDFYIR